MYMIAPASARESLDHEWGGLGCQVAGVFVKPTENPGGVLRRPGWHSGVLERPGIFCCVYLRSACFLVALHIELLVFAGWCFCLYTSFLVF